MARFYLFGNNMLPVTDPVESNYALTAKEMVLSGDWLSPQIYGTYWYDKPIMIYWLIALGFKIFWYCRLGGSFTKCYLWRFICSDYVSIDAYYERQMGSLA